MARIIDRLRTLGELDKKRIEEALKSVENMKRIAEEARKLKRTTEEGQ